MVVEPVDEDLAVIRRDTNPDNGPLSTDVLDSSLSPSNTPETDRRAGSVAWTALRTSLRLLHVSSSLFPILSSAVGVLISCVDGLEAAAKHQGDYEELATTLSAMVDSLRQCTNSILMSDSMLNIIFSLERQAMEMREKLSQVEDRGFRDASASEEELLRYYRRVQSLFQQLQINASLSTWGIMNTQLTNSRLEGLNPVKPAAYDSSLSTEVSRRGCTEGTRTEVLAGLNDWLDDPTSASIYWMNGMAGTGKTTIAYTFCEQVEKRRQLAASFFCTRNAVDCRNTSRILPTIAYQLARYSIPYQSALCQVLGQNPDIGSKHVLKQFELLLKDPLQQTKASMPGSLVVVIDALDECKDRNGVEFILEVLLRYTGHVPLKFLITGRPEPEIYNKMRLHDQSRAAIHLHDIEKSLVRADVELYLNEELAFMSPSQIEIEQLSLRSGSLFIYAATLVRYIIYGKHIANPRQRLKSVLSLTAEPTKKHAEIDALYTAVLESALQEIQMEDHETEDVKTGPSGSAVLAGTNQRQDYRCA
ncbi:unnamed protein product [Rhizoctonia solani]|uniref:Nephrocystin 3-like N-terminal domain-containing protein n=1 Tax=Rhizoctonia solani TaxID=456999 RepID=A0A8H2XLZ9_9AGAM|nr:unnamed protein product [Rhizoctonia solani]